MRRAVIALAAAAALLGAAPAAHARTDDLSKPVLLVAGPERGSCGAFDDLSAFLAEYTIRSGSERLGPGPGVETVGFGGGWSHPVGGGRGGDGPADSTP